MAVYGRALPGTELAVFVQDPARRTDLANVMQQSRGVQVLQRAAADIHSPGNGDGQIGNALRMAGGPRGLLVYCLCHGQDRLACMFIQAFTQACVFYYRSQLPCQAATQPGFLRGDGIATFGTELNQGDQAQDFLVADRQTQCAVRRVQQ